MRISFAFLATVQGYHCPPGWDIYTTKVGTQCLEVICDGDKTWSGAREFCESRFPGKSYLAVPESAAENTYMAGVRDEQMWIGLNNYGRGYGGALHAENAGPLDWQTGTFIDTFNKVYYKAGTEFGYNNFGSGEPNGSGDKRCFLKSGDKDTWNDVPCTAGSAGQYRCYLCGYDANECDAPSGTDTRASAGNCANCVDSNFRQTGKTHTCNCDAGYTLTGSTYGSEAGDTCTEDDECALNPNICGSNTICANQPGTYSCSCKAGFNQSGSGTSISCSDINECANPNICGANTNCSNLSGTYSCSCQSGFTQSGSGTSITCTDNDECTTTPGICGTNAFCSNVDGSYDCTCDAGYAQTGSGTSITCSAQWMNWGEFGCAHSCGPSQATRTRVCHGGVAGTDCEGVDTETQDCNEGPCGMCNACSSDSNCGDWNIYWMKCSNARCICGENWTDGDRDLANGCELSAPGEPARDFCDTVNCMDGNNGGCSHYCTDGACTCPICWSLGTDRKSCSPNSANVRTTCGHDSMTLDVDRCIFTDQEDAEVQIGYNEDPACQFSNADNVFSLTAGFNDCGFAPMAMDDKIVFSNTVASIRKPGTAGLVFGPDVTLKFKCSYSAVISDITTTSTVQTPSVDVGTDGEGSMQVRASYYTSNAFAEPMAEGTTITVGAPVYFAITPSTTINNVQFYVTSCGISDGVSTFNIIDDKCVNRAVASSMSGFLNTDTYHLIYTSFKFAESAETAQMSISCSIRMCLSDDCPTAPTC